MTRGYQPERSPTNPKPPQGGSGTAATRLINAVEAMKDMTIEIKVTAVRSLRVRLWIARVLFWLAGQVLNCKVKVKGPSA